MTEAEGIQGQVFASVWDALEDSPTEAANMRLRSELMIAIRQAVAELSITQAEAARRREVTQPRLNDLLRGRINNFSLDALTVLAARAGLDVHMQIPESRGVGDAGAHAFRAVSPGLRCWWGVLDFAMAIPWTRHEIPLQNGFMREPDIQSDGWCLEDGEKRHAESPTTFRIPPLEIREILQPGDFAKLIFAIAVEGEGEPQIERMWVIVRERQDGGYVGILDNEPSSISRNESFWRGTELPFKPSHVIDVRKRNAESVAIAAKPLP